MTTLSPKDAADDLQQRIVNRELDVGAKLPNPEDLGAYLTQQRGEPIEIKRSGAQRAYDRLKALGLVETTRGQGTFVRDLTGRDKLRLLLVMQHDNRGYHLQIKDRDGNDVRFDGLDKESKVQLGEAPPDIATLLELPAASNVIVRDRRIGWKRGHAQAPNRDQPMMWSQSYLPEWLVSEVPAVREQHPGAGGIYARIEEVFGPPLRWFGQAETGFADDSAAERLSLARPATVLRLFRITMLPDGRVAEVLDQRVSGDRFRLAYEIPRGDSAQLPAPPPPQ